MLLALLLALQDPAKVEEPCSMKNVEKAKWCDGCKGVVTADAWKKHQKDFGEDAAHKTSDIEVCVKRYYKDACGHSKPVISATAGVCHGKKMEEIVSRAVILYRCEGCKCSSPWKDKIAHAEGDHKRTLVKVCECSGTAPHNK